MVMLQLLWQVTQCYRCSQGIRWWHDFISAGWLAGSSQQHPRCLKAGNKKKASRLQGGVPRRGFPSSKIQHTLFWTEPQTALGRHLWQKRKTHCSSRFTLFFGLTRLWTQFGPPKCPLKSMKSGTHVGIGVKMFFWCNNDSSLCFIAQGKKQYQDEKNSHGLYKCPKTKLRPACGLPTYHSLQQRPYL